MTEPSAESLAGMGLLSKKESIQTKIVGLRDDNRRKAYYDKFIRLYGAVDDLSNVKWSMDPAPTAVACRCNANLVLLEIGARVPQEGDRVENTIPTILVLPKKALGEWSRKYLTVSHSQYKGLDRVLISEPAKMKVPRFFDYLPKMVHDTVDEEVNKFVEQKLPNNPGLAVEHVTVRFILMRCNFGMDHRGDVEDHTYYTHGVDLNELDMEASIVVHEGETLVLTPALNLKEMSLEGRNGVYESWFDASAANGTVTKVENRANAKIQKHKAGNLLKALKAAVGSDFYFKIYYHLQNKLKEGATHDLLLGFQCKWSLLIEACEDALGPMANVKRIKTYMNSKEHLKGGISLHNMLYKCANIVDETFGKVDVNTEQSDGMTRSNKPTKEF